MQDRIVNIPYIATECGGGIAKFEVVACTLRARDWKGLDNYGSNAVIVRRNKNEQPSTSNLHRGGVQLL